jgi:hypothetical protein
MKIFLLLAAYLLIFISQASAQVAGAQPEFCITSAAQTLNYNRLCLSVSSSGGAIDLTNFGTATGSLAVNGFPSLPAFNTICNPTGITATAIACPPLTAVAPIGISGTFPTQFLTANADDGTLHNIFIGNSGHGVLTTGGQNIGIGNFSLSSLTSGTGNVGTGSGALGFLTTGTNNFGLGTNAGTTLTTGISNVAIGTNALALGTTSSLNVAIGQNALAASTGNQSTGIGYFSCNGTTGAANTCLGYQAGTGITTGANNLILGPCNSGFSAGTAASIVLCTGDNVNRLDWNRTTASTWTFPGAVDYTGQIYSTTGTPTIASGACGATTNGTVGSGSTNQSGFINIGAAATTTCTLSWSGTLPVAPNACIFFPGNAAAAATGTTVAWAGAPSTASVILNGSALANTVYRYLCL